MKVIFKGVKSFVFYGAPGDIIDADFLQFYKKDLYKSIEKDRIRTFGLIGNLPPESRTYEEEIGGEKFGYIEGLLARIELFAHSLVWVQTSDAKTGRNKPELEIPHHIKQLQAEAKSQEESWKVAMTPEEIREYVYGKNFT